MPGKERRGTSRRPGPFPPSSYPFPHSVPIADRSSRPRAARLDERGPLLWVPKASLLHPTSWTSSHHSVPTGSSRCSPGLSGSAAWAPGIHRVGSRRKAPSQESEPFHGLADNRHPVWALLPACALLGHGSSGSLWAPIGEEGGRDPKPTVFGSWGMLSGVGGTLGRKEGGLAAKSGAEKSLGEQYLGLKEEQG